MLELRLSCLLTTLVCAAGAVSAQTTRPIAKPATAEQADKSRALLDGVEKSFLIVGYSTSYAWPTMLQQMLDEHAGGQRIYHVLNAVQGGAAVERWIAEPGSRHYERTMTAMQKDFFGPRARLRGEAPEPKIALCQQSLQFTRTQRGPIAKADDQEGIEIGADALEKLARQLSELGVEKVYYAMHVYKKPVEPEVGNERLALAALMKRDLPFVFDGPDVWQPTKDKFPASFEKDGVHPNELGQKIMVEGWYRTIAGEETKRDVIERLYARDYDDRPMMRDYLEWRRDGGAMPEVRLETKERATSRKQ